MPQTYAMDRIVRDIGIDVISSMSYDGTALLLQTTL